MAESGSSLLFFISSACDKQLAIVRVGTSSLFLVLVCGFLTSGFVDPSAMYDRS